MYHYANRPGKSTQRSRQTITQYFNTTVHGLPGNDGNTPSLSLRIFLFTRWQSYYQTAVQWAASWSSTSLDCTLSQQRSTSSSPRPSSRACHSSTRCSRQRRRYERRTFRRRRYSSRCVVASRFSAVSGTWLTDLQSVTVDGRPWKSNCFIEWDVFVRGSTVELELTEDPNVRCGVLPPSLSTGGFS